MDSLRVLIDRIARFAGIRYHVQRHRFGGTVTLWREGATPPHQSRAPQIPVLPTISAPVALAVLHELARVAEAAHERGAAA